MENIQKSEIQSRFLFYTTNIIYELKISWSCSSPRWDNLPSGHQRNPLLGLFGKVHVLGSKTVF